MNSTDTFSILKDNMWNSSMGRIMIMEWNQQEYINQVLHQGWATVDPLVLPWNIRHFLLTQYLLEVCSIVQLFYKSKNLKFLPLHVSKIQFLAGFWPILGGPPVIFDNTS